MTLPKTTHAQIPNQMNSKLLLKSLLTAKAALENDKKFVQGNGSEDDANLNHDGIFHLQRCIAEVQSSENSEPQIQGINKPSSTRRFQLWKDFHFEAAHQLTKVPAGHQCARMHGHSYCIRVHCEGVLDPERDWVVDYGEIARVVRPIIEKLDHTFLNHHIPLETTAENLAWWIMNQIREGLSSLSAVEVFETPTTSVMCHI
jgi:6-pyruvoyltetrahydropterin/6-carboxytetrahydropterin synthase